MSLWYCWQEDWLQYHKCTFDGVNRIIFVNDDVTELDISNDVYSDWKEWAQLRDNAKFVPACRTTGGDPIGGGAYTGDVYFLINNWKLRVDLRKVKITGVLFSDNFDTAYWDSDTALPLYPARVSSVVNTYKPNITVNAGDITVPTAVEIRQEIDTYSTKLAAIKAKTDTITEVVVPTAGQIADAVRVELTPELTHIMTLENNPGLTDVQATMLLEIYRLYGLSPTEPLIVTKTSRYVQGTNINQSITGDQNTTVVTRV